MDRSRHIQVLSIPRDGKASLQTTQILGSGLTLPLAISAEPKEFTYFSGMKMRGRTSLFWAQSSEQRLAIQ